MDRPWLGASDSRTLRGMTVANSLPLEVPLDLGPDLGGQRSPAVEESEHDALDLEGRIHPGAHGLERPDQLRQAFQGKILALERN